ncbi:MAG: ribosome maturation factor RimM [Eubacteriales bacterium]
MKLIKSFLEIGQIVGTHGVSGELRVNPWCDTPDFFKDFKILYFDEKGVQVAKVVSCRPHGNIVLLCLEGVTGIDAAAALRGKVLFMCRKDAHLPEGRYFVSDLVDCKVIDADDEIKSYGVLTDVSQTCANDVWHIKGSDGKEYLLPAIPHVVIHTDIEAGIVKIRPLEGIFNDED